VQDRRRQRLLVGCGGVMLSQRGVVRGLGGVTIRRRNQVALEELGLAAERPPRVDHAHQCLGRLRLRFGMCRSGVVDTGPGLLDLRLLVEDGGLGGLDVRAGLVDRRLEERRVDPRDDLPSTDDRVEVGGQLLDRPRHLAAHEDHDHGVEVAGRRH
jgi:hypothetical protein